MFAVQLGEGAELGPLEPWQAGEFAAHVDKARENISPYIPWADLVTDEEQARKFLQRYATRQAADEGRIYGIRLDGELVGGLLFRVFEANFGACELGVWLSAEAEGRGLITRAGRLLVDWAIGTRGLNRVEWRCAVGNTRSAATAQRLDMVLEGTLRQAFPYRGTIHDLQIWAITKDDWTHRSWA
ncbi:GNAT family N-acetyltransferase [Kribbella sindirgiensis]|uniref:N-acetyltransferase n=1 Tax=Kribbella sindirgiensis TaxID=1124744 RepID=A0A4R0JBW2_9ACTN|nr:GNAT family protein [Kribbella sindirgiensis]TCC42934.1 N-acetyltransferase [Kribbella sindirgiensis]